jgi:phosphatidylglycerol---prolipoprotein diacylglyceryl transferase
MVVDFDPDIFSFGPIHVRWYGMMYVVGFVLANYLLKVLVKRGFFKVEKEKVDSLISLMFICMFIGARLAYVFIYNWGYYQNHLMELFAVWNGGLSFHGALAGLLTGGFIFAKKERISWAQVMDNVALSGAPGLFFGRMGNFINGELYGRVTGSDFGFIFPAGGPYPRHPSQLYEGVLEGIVLSLILWFLLPRVKHYGYLASTFLIGYGVFRYIVEFFREADSQLGYYFGGTTTMGQILCMIMILVGFIALLLVRQKKLDN